MFALPGYVWALVLIGVIGIPALTCVVLWRGALAVGVRRRTALAVVGVTAVGWAGWVAGSAALADAGVYREDPAVTTPWLGVAAVGALVVVLLATRIPVVTRILAGPRMPALLAVPQALRVVGVAFLLVLALGKLPAVFAVPAGLGDMAVGVAAPFVARRLADGRRRGAVWFNLMGILDLVVAVSIGFLAGLGPDRLAVSPSTAAVALLPLVLIPTTAVPFATALHVMSLARLRVGVVKASPVPVG